MSKAWFSCFSFNNSSSVGGHMSGSGGNTIRAFFRASCSARNASVTTRGITIGFSGCWILQNASEGSTSYSVLELVSSAQQEDTSSVDQSVQCLQFHCNFFSVKYYVHLTRQSSQSDTYIWVAYGKVCSLKWIPKRHMWQWKYVLKYKDNSSFNTSIYCETVFSYSHPSKKLCLLIGH